MAVSTVYCTDEAILAVAESDYDKIIPDGQKLVVGDDGVFSSGNRWQLTSASGLFVSSQISAKHVVRIKKGDPGARSLYGADGEVFVVGSVDSATAITLRRQGFLAGQGLPPGEAGGTTEVQFTIKTAYPQIERVSYDINDDMGIDPNVPGKRPEDLYDLRKLERLCIYRVLATLYFDAWRRTTRNDVWFEKGKQAQATANEIKSSLLLQWQDDGGVQASTPSYVMRIVR